MSPIKESVLNTFRAEAEAVQSLAGQLTDDFEKAVRAILATHGKVIVTGMGKSGLVGRKIAATLASTGTPSFFLHPGEAYHGDLGMIEAGDIVLATPVRRWPKTPPTTSTYPSKAKPVR